MGKGLTFMFYKNARIYASDCRFHHGAFEVTEEGRFGQVLPDRIPEDAYDLENVRSMNQSKLEVVKQGMARVNVDILGISELKWTGMGDS